MEKSPIHKEIDPLAALPNVAGYRSFCDSFSWEGVRDEIEGLPGGGVNIGYEATERQLLKGKGEKVALRFLKRGGGKEELTYRELQRRSNRFANVLQNLAVEKGDSVFVLLNRCSELYIAALGCWKHRSIFSPLFSAFGPEPIRSRMQIGSAKVLVTSDALYRKKVKQIENELPDLEAILLIGEGELEEGKTLRYDEAMASASDEYSVGATAQEDVATYHFTSGTTGKPKGAIHVHDAVIYHYATGKMALDFHEEEIFFCTADPGWVTGTSYGIISPLVNGITTIVDEEEFDSKRWCHILESESVTVWYTAPTAIRMMMRSKGEELLPSRFPALRFIASVGEPLNPEAVAWGQKHFGMPIHDNWWQTETGGIMIANIASEAIKPGSMGRPLPGIEVALVARKEGGGLAFIDEPGVCGELAIAAGWPSMFRGYLHEEERYRQCFQEGYYLSGDLATVDEEGYYWFVGRKDDIIKSAGHLIGPFEVESALIEHPAVAEAAVIGMPDPVAMEVVTAFVSLHAGYSSGDELLLELLAFARKRLGAAIAPKEIHFVENLPKTRSGKIMRRLLKAQLLGLPTGDTSTLETSL